MEKESDSEQCLGKALMRHGKGDIGRANAHTQFNVSHIMDGLKAHHAGDRLESEPQRRHEALGGQTRPVCRAADALCRLIHLCQSLPHIPLVKDSHQIPLPVNPAKLISIACKMFALHRTSLATSPSLPCLPCSSATLNSSY
jgi:hypothetical protein